MTQKNKTRSPVDFLANIGRVVIYAWFFVGVTMFVGGAYSAQPNVSHMGIFFGATGLCANLFLAWKEVERR